MDPKPIRVATLIKQVAETDDGCDPDPNMSLYRLGWRPNSEKQATSIRVTTPTQKSIDIGWGSDPNPDDRDSQFGSGPQSKKVLASVRVGTLLKKRTRMIRVATQIEMLGEVRTGFG